MNIEELVSLVEKRAMRWTNHILVRLFQRGISMDDVEYGIKNGEIIEQYPDDYPHPSCLILGYDVNGNAFHIVCGSSGIELYLITAYYPNIEEWEADLKTRSVKE